MKWTRDNISIEKKVNWKSNPRTSQHLVGGHRKRVRKSKASRVMRKENGTGRREEGLKVEYH